MLEKLNIESKETPSKKYLYHMVPKDLRGNVLHPLNDLQNIHPDLYLAKVTKYQGRESVMEKIIPTLECKWNDVLFFSPVDPKELKDALVEAGMEPREMSFYQIDPELLDPSKTTIYLFNRDLPPEQIDTLVNYTEYNPKDLEKHSKIPEKTKLYFLEEFKKNKRPLMFIGIPHILHKGPLDISDLPVITV